MSRILTLVAVVAFGITAWAAGQQGPADAAAGDKLVERLKGLRPDIPIERVSATVVGARSVFLLRRTFRSRRITPDAWPMTLADPDRAP